MAGQRLAFEGVVSAREAEVLAALGEHLTNAEIGARLFISIRTVESHVSSLLRKLRWLIAGPWRLSQRRRRLGTRLEQTVLRRSPRPCRRS